MVDRWNTYVVDGRDVEALCQVFWQATQVKNKPTAIVAKTFKGRGTPSKQVFYFFLPGVIKNVCLAQKTRQRETRAGWTDRLSAQ